MIKNEIFVEKYRCINVFYNLYITKQFNMSEKRKTKIIKSSTSQQKTPRKRVLTKSQLAKIQPVEMLFKKENFYFIFGGLALIAIGFALMSGGHMPSSNVWDDSLIYSFRRVFIAPLVILIGIGVSIFAVFKK